MAQEELFWAVKVRLGSEVLVSDFYDAVERANRDIIPAFALGICLQSTVTVQKFCFENDIFEVFEYYEKVVTSALSKGRDLTLDPAMLPSSEDFVDDYFSMSSIRVAFLACENVMLGKENEVAIQNEIKNEIVRVSEDLGPPDADFRDRFLDIPEKFWACLQIHLRLLERGEVPEAYFERCGLTLFPT